MISKFKKGDEIIVVRNKPHNLEQGWGSYPLIGNVGIIKEIMKGWICGKNVQEYQVIWNDESQRVKGKHYNGDLVREWQVELNNPFVNAIKAVLKREKSKI